MPFRQDGDELEVVADKLVLQRLGHNKFILFLVDGAGGVDNPFDVGKLERVGQELLLERGELLKPFFSGFSGAFAQFYHAWNETEGGTIQCKTTLRRDWY